MTTFSALKPGLISYTISWKVNQKTPLSKPQHKLISERYHLSIYGQDDQPIYEESYTQLNQINTKVKFVSLNYFNKVHLTGTQVYEAKLSKGDNTKTFSEKTHTLLYTTPSIFSIVAEINISQPCVNERKIIPKIYGTFLDPQRNTFVDYSSQGYMRDLFLS
ncbi:MAG: hypothetical protein S4CHLAM7_01640 [Chlamydiae bacterium]|nr:hypothetical protein [Chlamydiota bacterium]